MLLNDPIEEYTTKHIMYHIRINKAWLYFTQKLDMDMWEQWVDTLQVKTSL